MKRRIYVWAGFEEKEKNMNNVQKKLNQTAKLFYVLHETKCNVCLGNLGSTLINTF